MIRDLVCSTVVPSTIYTLLVIVDDLLLVHGRWRRLGLALVFQRDDCFVMHDHRVRVVANGDLEERTVDHEHPGIHHVREQIVLDALDAALNRFAPLSHALLCGFNVVGCRFKVLDELRDVDRLILQGAFDCLRVFEQLLVRHVGVVDQRIRMCVSCSEFMKLSHYGVSMFKD